MTTKVFNGVTYDLNLLKSYGYSQEVVAGTGETLPRQIAVLVDAIVDAGSNMVTTSASSVAIGTGAKTFVLANDLPVFAGMRGYAIDTANSANYMFFEVTSYTQSTFTLVIDSQVAGGSGTKTSWNLFLGAGLRGETGASGSADIIGETTDTTIDPADYELHYDSSAADNKKILYSDKQKQRDHEIFFFI